MKTAHPVGIRVDHSEVQGDLTVPEQSSAVVVFAHGSGSSRFSRRNREVAEQLQRAGLATLLLDLLTGAEEDVDVRTAEFRFDIELLGERVIRAIDWLDRESPQRFEGVGLFGASTGAAAALHAAARRAQGVGAVVSRGGRPDLAGPALPNVTAPTLLIVGGLDHRVLRLNDAAQRQLGGKHRLAVVYGATHLFEEPGALDRVAALAARWFTDHLPGCSAARGAERK